MNLFWHRKYPFVNQNDSEDCGIACLVMIFRYLVGNISYRTVAKICDFTYGGMPLKGMLCAARKLDMEAKAFYATEQFLRSGISAPLIALVNEKHYVVVYSAYNKRNQGYVKVADPSFGMKIYKLADFLRIWMGDNGKGVFVQISSTSKSESHVEFYRKKTVSMSRLVKGLASTWKGLSYLLFSFVVILCIQLLLPFLTQSLVDKGIGSKQLNVIWLILIAQMALIVSKSLADISRAQVSLYLSSRITIGLISDYLKKLFRLPMRFFTKRTVGDMIQRMEDHSRIATFLSTDTVSISVSAIGFIVSSIVLLCYSGDIFLVYIGCVAIYTLWTLLFLGMRKRLDYEYFDQRSIQTSSMYQLYDGIEEIKLQGCTRRKREEFETIYAKGLRLGIRRLSLFQTNRIGATLINQGRYIIITVITSLLVIRGELTLGALLAIQYVIGQMDSPVDEIVNFMYKLQDLKIGLNRINTVYDEEDEVKEASMPMPTIDTPCDIVVSNLSYKYNLYDKEDVLHDISFTLPRGKVTAVVGLSGSGKTTLLKLLLGYDKPVAGSIMIGNQNLEDINIEEWRKTCGVVMQEGYVFSDTIENNIAVSDDATIDAKRMDAVVEDSCIKDIVMSSPRQFMTKIGKEGRGLSKGQKQRILISRIMYKNPNYVFLDEATNSLDSYTEKLITENFQRFFVNKTVMVIAHRMSTIRNADNIIVLDRGRIVEQGRHEDLMKRRGRYYNLVCNQVKFN